MSAETTTAPAPSSAQVRPLPYHTQRAVPGAVATGFARGDVVLVAGRAADSRLIRFGQRLRIHGADRVYVKWTHAALIVDTDGTLIEPVGAGVRRWHIDRYVDDEYVVVHLTTSQENRDEAVAFAEWALRRRARYNRLSTVGTALSMLTGSTLTLFLDGRFVCSGLVARALERSGVIFDRDAANIAPADLAKYFRAATPTHTAAWAGALRKARTGSARERTASLR